MKISIKKNRCCFFFFLVFLIFVYCYLVRFFPSLAQEQKFSQNHDVFYDFQDDGLVTVTQDITLTNLVSKSFANSFVIIIDSLDIENVMAFIESQEIKTEISSNQNETRIKLNFPEKIVGKGRQFSFKVSYQQRGIAQKTGQIWNINLPQNKTLKGINEYQIYLSIPKEYGNFAQAAPEPAAREESENNFLFKYEKSQLEEGVSLAFGEVQVFDFILTYHLENPLMSQKRLNIALPPDTGYQKVYLEKIDPNPNEVNVDPDGNWIASFDLKAQENMNVNVSGYAKIFSQPILNEAVRPKDPFQDIGSDYLSDKEYWPVSDQKIVTLANELNSSRNIYQFVVDHLNYNYDLLGQKSTRLGALAALEHPQEAICTEYTDLFITISRAAGVPAREINGYAYTTNPKLRPLSLVSDVLHAWPEYYDQDKGKWIAVDPTWEKTSGINYFDKLDMNHFAFVIHGLDSQKPLPAGTYKAQTMNKDVQIVFGQARQEQKTGFDIILQANEKIYRETKKIGKVIVKNPGPGAAYNQSVIINLSSQEEPIINHVSVIPPYGKVELPIEYQNFSFSQQKEMIVIRVNDKEFRQQLDVESWFIQKILPFVIVFFSGLTALFSFKKVAFKRGNDLK